MRVFVPILGLLLTFGMVSGFVLPTITRTSFAPVRTNQPIPDGIDRFSLPLQEAVLFASKSNDDTTSESFSREPLSIAASLWGTGGVLYVLIEAFRQTLPSALAPIRASVSFTPLQWLAFAATVVIFTYGQGIRCFQLRLAPLVVKRSCILTSGEPQKSFPNFVFAPIYASGLISSNKVRLIKSHSVIWGTAALQVALHRGLIVKNDAPLMNILNGGFAAGFAWGVVSLAYQYGKALWTGRTPSIDAGFQAK